MEALALALNARTDTLNRFRLINRASGLTQYTIQQATQWFNETQQAITAQNTTDSVKINFANYYNKTKTNATNLGGLKYTVGLNLRQADKFYVRLKTDKPQNAAVYARTNTGWSKMTRVPSYNEYVINNVNQTIMPTVDFTQHNAEGLINTTNIISTIRLDDAPADNYFSLAVESATTNLVASNGATPYTNNNAQVPPGIPIVYKGYINSTNNYAIIFNASTNISLNSSESLTVSAYVYPLKANNSFNCVLVSNLNSNRNIGTVSNLPVNKWSRIVFTYTATSSETITQIRIETNLASAWTGNQAETYIANVQAEKLPFATSFVNGSRNAGVIELPTVDKNFASKVVMGWFKINRNATNRIFDMANGTNNATTGWAFFYDASTSQFRFTIGNTTQSYTYTSAINRWFFVVLIFNNGTYTVKLYDNESKKWDQTFNATMPNVTSYTFRIGNIGSSGSYALPLNGVVSNVVIASFNQSIWTNEFIDSMYEYYKTHQKTYKIVPITSSDYFKAIGNVVAVNLSTLTFNYALRDFFAPAQITNWTQLLTNSNITSVVGQKKGYHWLNELIPAADGQYSVRLTYEKTTNTYRTNVKSNSTEYTVYELPINNNDKIHEILITYDNFDALSNETMSIYDVKAYANINRWLNTVNNFTINTIVDSTNDEYNIAILANGAIGRKIQFLAENIRENTSAFKMFAIIQKVNNQWQLYDSDGLVSAVSGTGDNVTITFETAVAKVAFGIVKTESNNTYTISQNIYGLCVVNANNIQLTLKLINNTLVAIPDNTKVCIIVYN